MSKNSRSFFRHATTSQEVFEVNSPNLEETTAQEELKKPQISSFKNLFEAISQPQAVDTDSEKAQFTLVELPKKSRADLKVEMIEPTQMSEIENANFAPNTFSKGEQNEGLSSQKSLTSIRRNFIKEGKQKSVSGKEDASISEQIVAGIISGKKSNSKLKLSFSFSDLKKTLEG